MIIIRESVATFNTLQIFSFFKQGHGSSMCWYYRLRDGKTLVDKFLYYEQNFADKNTSGGYIIVPFISPDAGKFRFFDGN